MIPRSSQVLIIGVSPVSLILAASLAKLGVEVIVVNEDSYSIVEEIEYPVDTTDIYYLKDIGFDFSEKSKPTINVKQIEKQALKLLANSLCNILWDTISKDKQSSAGRFSLKLESKAEAVDHQTSIIVSQKDLELGGSFIASFKNAFILSWKIQGYLSGLLAAIALNLHHEEKDIIKNYYAEDDVSKSVLHKLYNRFLKVRKGALNFRDSKINLHLSQFRKITAGDLLPDLNLYDEKLKIETSLYDWCKLGKFSVLMLGDLPAYNLNHYANWIKANYQLDIYYLPFTGSNASIFEAFEVPGGEKKTVIVRPDRYIGFINDRIELEIIENYLNNILFMYPNTRAFSPKGLSSG